MIGRKAMLPLLNLGLGAVLGLVALKLIAVYFNPEVLGEVTWALAFLGVLYLFSDLNMSEAHVKRVSEGENVGDCFATFAAFRLVSTTVFVLAALAIIVVRGPVLGKPIEATTVGALLLGLVYYVSKAAQSIAQSTFEARLEAARSQVPSFVETLVRVPLTAVVAFAFASVALGADSPLYGFRADNPVWRWVAENPAAAVMATYAIGSLAGMVVAFHYLRQSFERGRFRWDLLRSYFAFALPLFTISAVTVFAAFVGPLALGYFRAAVDTGEFEAPRRLVTVLEGVGGAASLLLFPLISGMLHRGDRAGVYSLVDRSIRYLSMLTLPIAAFLVAFPVPVIRLVLAEDWVGNAATLAVLAVWVYLTTISRPHVNLLMGANQPGAVARIGVVASLIHVAATLYLVPDDIQSLGIRLGGLGALGAALAALVSGTCYYALVVLATRSMDGYRPPLAILKHVLAGAVMVGALLALDHGTGFPLGRWYTFAVYVPLGAAIYAAALVLLGELRRDDVRFVKAVLHPGEMGRYLKSELWDRQR